MASFFQSYLGVKTYNLSQANLSSGNTIDLSSGYSVPNGRFAFAMVTSTSGADSPGVDSTLLAGILRIPSFIGSTIVSGAMPALIMPGTALSVRLKNTYGYPQNVAATLTVYEFAVGSN